MALYFVSTTYAPWLAPYAYAVFLLAFGFFLFRFFENWYASRKDKPLYRHLLVYKKLKEDQLRILENDFPFYQKITPKNQRQFQHRVSHFIGDKQFVGRDDLIITEKMKVLIAATACMVSFGRKNYEYSLIEFILVYPGEFYSTENGQYHKGEFNPREKALVLSWKAFIENRSVEDGNRNLGIHEFMHAMQLEANGGKDLDSSRFQKQFQNILKQLTLPEVKERLENTQFFRKHAFSNQYEFMAVLAEYFFDSPVEFKTEFPKLYLYFRRLLNFNFADW